MRRGASQVIFESYPIDGYSYRMTDIRAVVGRVQLKRLPEIVATRRVVATRYEALMAGIPGLVLPTEPPGLAPTGRAPASGCWPTATSWP